MCNGMVTHTQLACATAHVRRYYGINDPVANKMLRRVGDMPKLETPEDTSITTL